MASFQERMQALRQAFTASLPGDVEAAADHFRRGERDQAAAVVHQIAGRAGTFGAPDVSEAAGQIEQLLATGTQKELEAAFDALLRASCEVTEHSA